MSQDATPRIVVYVPIKPDGKEPEEVSMALENARVLREWLENNLPPRRRQSPAKGKGAK